MRPETPDIQVILERLNSLEKQNRRLRQAGVLVLIGIGALLLTGQVVPPNRTIEAQKFVLTDTEGRSRGEWSADRTRSELALYDQEGRRSV